MTNNNLFQLPHTGLQLRVGFHLPYLPPALGMPEVCPCSRYLGEVSERLDRSPYAFPLCRLFVKNIPHGRSNKSEDDPDDKNNGYQHRRRSKIKRSNFIRWGYEMKSKDKINETLRPAEPHQERPKQMPNSADYPKHKANEIFVSFHRLRPLPQRPTLFNSSLKFCC
jgi:hypothetical protein